MPHSPERTSGAHGKINVGTGRASHLSTVKSLGLLHDLQEYIISIESLAADQAREVQRLKEEKREAERTVVRYETDGLGTREGNASAAMYAADIKELPPRVRAMLEDNKMLKDEVRKSKHRIKELETQLTRCEAEVLAGQAKNKELKQHLAACSRTMEDVKKDEDERQATEALAQRIQELEKANTVLKSKTLSDERRLTGVKADLNRDHSITRKALAEAKEQLGVKTTELRAAMLEIRALQRRLVPGASPRGANKYQVPNGLSPLPESARSSETGHDVATAPEDVATAPGLYPPPTDNGTSVPPAVLQEEPTVSVLPEAVAAEAVLDAGHAVDGETEVQEVAAAPATAVEDAGGTESNPTPFLTEVGGIPGAITTAAEEVGAAAAEEATPSESAAAVEAGGETDVAQAEAAPAADAAEAEAVAADAAPDAAAVTRGGEDQDGATGEVEDDVMMAEPGEDVEGAAAVADEAAAGPSAAAADERPEEAAIAQAGVSEADGVDEATAAAAAVADAPLEAQQDGAEPPSTADQAEAEQTPPESSGAEEDATTAAPAAAAASSVGGQSGEVEEAATVPSDAVSAAPADGPGTSGDIPAEPAADSGGAAESAPVGGTAVVPPGPAVPPPFERTAARAEKGKPQAPVNGTHKSGPGGYQRPGRR